MDEKICTKNSARPHTPSADAKNIFLTGATGFLGAFLLFELLKRTSANIYCLVRSSSEEEGKNELAHRIESIYHCGALVYFFSSEMNPNKRRSQQFDCHNTIAGLNGTAIRYPKINPALLETYFSYLIRRGFLHLPGKKAS